MGKRQRNRRRAEGYYKLPRESRAAHGLRNNLVVQAPCHECGKVRTLEANSRLCFVQSCMRARAKKLIAYLEELEAAENAKCDTCGGGGLVAAVPGLGSEGTEPCPDCGPEEVIDPVIESMESLEASENAVAA